MFSLKRMNLVQPNYEKKFILQISPKQDITRLRELFFFFKRAL